jgi:hypothetical protein
LEKKSFKKFLISTMVSARDIAWQLAQAKYSHPAYSQLPFQYTDIKSAKPGAFKPAAATPEPIPMASQRYIMHKAGSDKAKQEAYSKALAALYSSGANKGAAGSGAAASNLPQYVRYY